MLKTVERSSNSKTGPIAVTYRAGKTSPYSSCPATCSLMPADQCGAVQLDEEYMQALLDAVPRRGLAWTYSHFPAEALPIPKAGKTVINASCDTMAAAVHAVELGRPAVYAAPLDTAGTWPKRMHGVQFVQCPADMADNFNCAQCGNGSPLCSRGDRDYVVVFLAHGTSKKKVGTDTKGGCYGSSGPVMIQWRKTGQTGHENEGQALRKFAAKLPPGSMIRHHVVGDMGALV